MSTRLAFQTLEFETALNSEAQMAIWEEEQLAKLQSLIQGPNAKLDDLLACAELALRRENADLAQTCLDKAFQLQPQDPDAHYLSSALAVAQNDLAQGLERVTLALSQLSGTSVDHARLSRMKARLLWLQNKDLLGAVQALKQAFQWAGDPGFVHVTTRSEADISADQLVFDMEVFDSVYAWDQSPLPVKFCAVATGPQDQVYLLENRNKWILEYDAAGKFVQGLNEKNLMGRVSEESFLHPEHTWQLTDLVTDHEGRIYVAGNRDVIHVFNAQWQKLYSCTPPASERELKPLSLAVDQHQNLYVLYTHLSGVHVFNAEGFHLGSFGNNTTLGLAGKNYYCGLACDRQNRLYLYDRLYIQVFDTASRTYLKAWEVPEAQESSLDDENYPYCWNGMGLGAEGQMLLCQTYENQVLVLNAEAKIQEKVAQLDQGLQTLQQPMDLAVDKQGRLYIVDTGNARVLKRDGTQWSVLLGHPSFRHS